MNDFGLALDFLSSQSAEGLVRLFWFTLSLEIPRYACGFVALGLAAASAERRVARAGYASLAVRPTVSVIVVGHNEADALERCLRSLQEQTLRPTEVVVISDGSSDGMAAMANILGAIKPIRLEVKTLVIVYSLRCIILNFQ